MMWAFCLLASAAAFFACSSQSSQPRLRLRAGGPAPARACPQLLHFKRFSPLLSPQAGHSQGPGGSSTAGTSRAGASTGRASLRRRTAARRRSKESSESTSMALIASRRSQDLNKKPKLGMPSDGLPMSSSPFRPRILFRVLPVTCFHLFDAHLRHLKCLRACGLRPWVLQTAAPPAFQAVT